MTPTSNIMFDCSTSNPNVIVPPSLKGHEHEQLVLACAENLYAASSRTIVVSHHSSNVNAQVLKTKDKVKVLQQFQLPMGGKTTMLKISIVAKKVHDQKSGQCFRTAK